MPSSLHTTADEVRRILAQGPRYYVYVLCRPDGRPFYVGKGLGERILHHEAEARTTRRLTHKLNLIRALHRRSEAVCYRFDSFHDEERAALARERELIRTLGRHDLGLGPLTNQTDGGEGTSNPSEESRQRRRETLWGDAPEDDERQVANRFFQKLCSVKSVPIKPLGRYRVEGLWANRADFPLSRRSAAALAASAIANRILLEPGALIPRRLSIAEVDLIIENGAGRDMLSSGMAELASGQEGFEVLKLTWRGHESIIQHLGRDVLEDAGVLMPLE